MTYQVLARVATCRQKLKPICPISTLFSRLLVTCRLLSIRLSRRFTRLPLLSSACILSSACDLTSALLSSACDLSFACDLSSALLSCACDPVAETCRRVWGDGNFCREPE